jgi:hypothetical protein
LIAEFLNLYVFKFVGFEVVLASGGAFAVGKVFGVRKGFLVEYG